MKVQDFLTNLFKQFAEIKADVSDGIKQYLTRYSEKELDILWKRFDGYYDSDRAPTTGTLRKMASDAGINQNKSGDGSIKKWLLRCNYCQMYRADDGGGTCPHCKLHSHYTIVATQESPSEANQGRRLSREEYEALHFAHPELVCLEKSKTRKIELGAQAFVTMLGESYRKHVEEERGFKPARSQQLNNDDTWS